MFKLCHCLKEHLRITERLHGFPHHIHADKQDSKPRHNLACVPDPVFSRKQNQNHPKKSQKRRNGSRIQCNQLTGDCGADICPHDNPDRLAQSHHPGIHKANDHDRGG